MKVGFLGTGAIAEAMLIGLCEAAAYRGSIIVSERSASRSSMLAGRFDNVEIASSNQELVNECDLLFLSVLPDQLEDSLGQLDFAAVRKVVSLVAGFNVGQIEALIGQHAQVYRIIPLPPIEHGVGPIPIYPQDQELIEWLGQIGEVIELENEQDFSAFSAASAVMASHFEMMSTVSKWMESQGVDRKLASTYSTSIYGAISLLASHGVANDDELAKMSLECLTEGGLNEQVLRELSQSGWFAAMHDRLDRIATRLAK